VDNERQLKIEFRRALDDVLPPAPWLASTVVEGLRKRHSRESVGRGAGKSQHTRGTLPRPVLQLAAGLLIVMLAATAVAAFLELRHRAQQSTPAGPLTIAAYQALVSRDDGELIISRNDDCSTLQSACPAPGRPALIALQRWVDDLDRSTPPTRFAVIDAQLRRHLAANISALHAEFTAYQAKDQGALQRTNFATGIEANWLDDVATSISSSHRATVAAYVGSLQVGERNLGSCTSCQSLSLSDQVVCAGDQAMSCLYEIFYAESVIGQFEASLVQVVAPDSMAATDARLQQDLASADTALLTLTADALAGDQAGFDSGRAVLQQALPAINTDIAGIVKS
jgi:hypothetical protein